MKFATERHSVAVMQDTNQLHEPNSYSLSTSRLPQSKSATKKKTTTNNKKDISNEPESSIVDTCLAHSSLVLGDCAASPAFKKFSVEIFAMMRTTEKQDSSTNSIDKSSFDKATIHRRQFSEAGASRDLGGDTNIISGRKISTDASTIISSASTLKNDGIIGDNTATVKFYLLVKVKGGGSLGGISDQQVDSSEPVTASQISVKEIMPLDFRPLFVHAAEVHVITSESHPNSSSSPAIGIFVASVDDNRLRLFMAPIVDVETWKRSDKNKGAKSDARCFAPITLDGAATSSPSDNNQERTVHEHSIDDSLVFTTPIMALDSYITEEEYHPSDGEKIIVKMNRLAIACYDGTVRIVTYHMINQRREKDDDNDSSYQFYTLRCSRFIVDGPVVSLQFGDAKCASKVFSRAETPSLYLVAGSLCGFACVFYEALLPPSPNQVSKHSFGDRFFDGPLLVVDGLDDGLLEGNVDCVTAVHVSNAGTQQVILVGTQSGRIIVLQQCYKKRMEWNRTEAEVVLNRQTRDELQFQIDQRRTQLSVLETEHKSMATKANDLRITISTKQSNSNDIPELLSENVELTSDIGDKQDLNAELKDACFDESMGGMGGDGAETETSLPITISNTDTTALTQIELASLERSIGGIESTIADLSIGLFDLHKRRAECAEKADRLSGSLLHSIHMRKFHQYVLLRDYHFPHPIHGIASGHRIEGDVSSQEIFVSTMRSFHVCLLLDEVASSAAEEDEEKSPPIN